MNRAEFMQQLGALLGELPVSERTEALKYYADYFDEAGTENEEKVIKELESPQKVAQAIKAELNAKDKESGEFTEKGYKNPAYSAEAVPAVNAAAGQTGNTPNDSTKTGNAQSSSTENGYTPPKNSAGKTALIVILCILLIPVGLPCAAAVLSLIVSVVITIFSALFGLIIGFAAAAVGLIAAAVALFIVACINLPSMPFVGFVLIGAALLMAALGLLFVLLTVLLCGKALPAIFKGIVYVCGLPFRKKEVVV